MTRISPIFAAAADAIEAASAASDVQTDVIGDSDGLVDEHGEGATASALMNDDVTPPSSWSPPADMVSTFDSLVGINSEESETKRLGLYNIRCPRWTAPDSGYCPF